ncbi:MAG: PDZ domain-containing protein [Acidobacteria bacterium]|nr:PDZ domain-containing protein [Acidobacteriota bacterium]
MPKSFRISILAVSVVVVLTAFLGANSSRVRAASDEKASNAYTQIDVYSDVLHHIQADYVVDPNMKAVTNGALRGLLESLDSNSGYLSPGEYKIYKEHKIGQAGIGIHAAKRYGYATVVSVVPDSPADKAGLADGDILESIGDSSTRDMSLAMVESMLHGAPGTQVTVAVVRPRRATPEKVVLTRTNIAEPAVSDSLYESATILYLKPVILDKEHVQQIEQKVKNMGRMGSKKILLDLRDVSAGDDTEALRMANFFIKNGTLATLEGQKVAKQTFSADPSKAINTNAPMITLINRGTAGPAELVAGALLDSKRSQLVGEKSFGDGSQQKLFELPDGGAIILSIAKYETPSGKKLQDEGITPDVQVASAADTADEADVDEDDSSTVEAKPVQSLPKPAPHSDDQLNKALELLKAKAA